MKPDFKIVELKRDEKVPVRCRLQLKPTHLFILPNGAIDEGMSYAIVMESMIGDRFVAQISHKMFTDAWDEFEKRQTQPDKFMDTDRHDQMKEGDRIYVLLRDGRKLFGTVTEIFHSLVYIRHDDDDKNFEEWYRGLHVWSKCRVFLVEDKSGNQSVDGKST